MAGKHLFSLILALTFSAMPMSAARADDPDAQRDIALKLNEITGNSPMEGRLRQLIRDEAGTKKLIEAAVKMTKDKPQPFNYNAAFLLARAAHAVRDFSAAEILFKVASERATKLQSANKILQVYDGLIDLFYDNKKYDDAIKACKEFLDLNNTDPTNPINRAKPFIMERMIQSLSKKGKIDDALKLTQELVDADEGGWYFLKLKAEVYREAGKLDDAAKTYEETLDRLKKMKEIEEDRRDRFMRGIRYTLSGVYVDMKKIDKAATQLETLLKADPDNPTFNNDLGFIWADHDMKFDESEKLIRKAIDEDRKQRKKIDNLPPEDDVDNAAYLDSLGWVLYKKKDFKEAKKQLLEAIKQKEGQHIEILDHLADVHIALDEKDEAIKVWEKALKTDAEDLTKREKQKREEVEKKLKKAKESK